MLFSSVCLVLSAVSLVVASPLQPRADADYTTTADSCDKFCMIMPRNDKTTVGDSESSREQMQSWCSSAARTSEAQGLLPGNFWSKCTYQEGTGASGKKWKQLTGTLTGDWPHLDWKDGGGQYDSNGGDGGRGNPSGSVCSGDYPVYVELVEPQDKRACIRCCQDMADCRTDRDTAGCPAVIPGPY